MTLVAGHCPFWVMATTFINVLAAIILLWHLFNPVLINNIVNSQLDADVTPLPLNGDLFPAPVQMTATPEQ